MQRFDVPPGVDRGDVRRAARTWRERLVVAVEFYAAATMVAVGVVGLAFGFVVGEVTHRALGPDEAGAVLVEAPYDVDGRAHATVRTVDGTVGVARVSGAVAAGDETRVAVDDDGVPTADPPPLVAGLAAIVAWTAGTSAPAAVVWVAVSTRRADAAADAVVRRAAHTRSRATANPLR